MNMENLCRVMVPRGHSLETGKLIERLRSGRVGDVLTDADLATITGQDCSPGSNGYGKLQTAIKWCVREHHIHWQRVRSARLIKCVSSAETATAVGQQIQQVHRNMKRAAKLAACVKLDDLKPDEQRTFLATTALAGTLAQFSDNSAVKALETLNVSTPLDFAKTLQLMEGKKGVPK